jgi:poly-beta-1,6-N-acetyl-D-glucosamine synthase
MKCTKIVVYVLLYVFTVDLIVSSLLLTPHPLDSPYIYSLRVVIIFFASVLLSKYTCYMVLAPWRGVRTPPPLDDAPLVSILIPAWNEEVGLLATIKTLLGSSYKNMEIVVVNDGSTDNSDRMVRVFLRRYEEAMADVPYDKHIRILYHYQQNGGKGSALNTAIALSHGDILMSIDADCVVTETAVEHFVAAFRDPQVMAAVGNVRVGNTKTLIGVIQSLEYTFGFYQKKADSVLNTIYIVGGAAGAFRRAVFDQLGGYDGSNITEDIELSTRVQKAGMKIVYVPDAIVYTEGASTLQGLLKQRLRWKRGRFQTFWKHSDLFFSMNARHNLLLSWVILPLALFSEVQLAMEPLFLTALYVFGFLSADYSAFISGILVVSLMFVIQAWDSKHLGNIWLAPIGWLLFYLCTFVEVYALVRSGWLVLRKKEVRWQKWQRAGLKEHRA